MTMTLQDFVEVTDLIILKWTITLQYTGGP